jgi:hypothetical protein
LKAIHKALYPGRSSSQEIKGIGVEGGLVDIIERKRDRHG